jgi:hypothetical protein
VGLILIPIIILLAIFLIIRVIRLIKMLFMPRFWGGVLLQVLFGIFVSIFVLPSFENTISDNQWMIPTFTVVGWFVLVFTSRTFRMPLMFLLGVVSIGLLFAGIDSDFEASADFDGDFDGGNDGDFSGDSWNDESEGFTDVAESPDVNGEVEEQVPFLFEQPENYGSEELVAASVMSDFSLLDNDFDNETGESTDAFESDSAPFTSGIQNYLFGVPQETVVPVGPESANVGYFQDSFDKDMDNDHVPDNMDYDIDNDHAIDTIDHDFDNDRIPDSIDGDMDNDHIPDEYDSDIDNDHIPDSVDHDMDNDHR